MRGSLFRGVFTGKTFFFRVFTGETPGATVTMPLFYRRGLDSDRDGYY